VAIGGCTAAGPAELLRNFGFARASGREAIAVLSIGCEPEGSRIATKKVRMCAERDEATQHRVGLVAVNFAGFGC
jgi:hypothetical protein